MTDDEVDQQLRALGADPDKIRTTYDEQLVDPKLELILLALDAKPSLLASLSPETISVLLHYIGAT